MPPYKYKTGISKANQRKQMYVYTDNWVAMHNKITQLEQEVKYWMIEAKTDHDRWLHVLEDFDALRKQHGLPPFDSKDKA